MPSLFVRTTKAILFPFWGDKALALSPGYILPPLQCNIIHYSKTEFDSLGTDDFYILIIIAMGKYIPISTYILHYLNLIIEYIIFIICRSFLYTRFTCVPQVLIYQRRIRMRYSFPAVGDWCHKLKIYSRHCFG